ncbi:MAG: hypothetical protein IKG08_08845 [Eubacterium sp.]|nr:hypothetical protein [Eubacterium sp.]
MENKSPEKLLAEMVRYQKKLERNTKITSIVNIVLCIVLVIAFAVVVPTIRVQMGKLEESMGKIDRMVQSVDEFVGNANAVIVENADTVTEAMQKLNGIEFDVLNEAIVNLNNTVKPLAEFMQLFQH